MKKNRERNWGILNYTELYIYRIIQSKCKIHTISPPVYLKRKVYQMTLYLKYFNIFSSENIVVLEIISEFSLWKTILRFFFTVQVRETMGIKRVIPRSDISYHQWTFCTYRPHYLRRVHGSTHRPNGQEWDLCSHNHSCFIWRWQNTVST